MAQNSILQKDASELFGGSKAQSGTDVQAANVEAFLSSVFTYMAAALAISGGLAWAFGETYLSQYLSIPAKPGAG